MSPLPGVVGTIRWGSRDFLDMLGCEVGELFFIC